MPLLEYPFATGIDQRTRQEYVDGNGAWLNLENIRVPKTGGADKRYGFTALAVSRLGASARSAGHRLLSDGLNPVVLDGTTVDAYSVGAATNINHGKVPEAVFSLRDLPTMGKAGTVEDIEYCNGYFCVSSITTVSGTSYASAVVMDATTNTVVHGPYLFGTFTNLLVCSYSNYFVAVKCDTTGTAIYTMYFDTTAPASGWTAIGTVTSSWSAGPTKVGVCSMTDRVAIVYATGSGTNRTSVATWNILGSVDSTTIATASTTPDGVDIDIGPSSDTLWVTWNQGTAVKVCGLTPTNLSVVLATSATILTATSSSPYPKICASSDTVSKARCMAYDYYAYDRIRIGGVQITAGAAAADGTAKLVANALPIGKPFARGGRYYCLTMTGNNSGTTTYQGGAVIVDWTDDVTWIRPVCVIDSGLASSPVDICGKCVASSSSTKRYLTVNLKRSSVANAAQMVELDFASTDRWQPVAHGNSTYLGGGVTGYFDGRQFHEAGFIQRPPKITTATSGTGITLSSGARYVAVYEAIDADGNLTISGVSDPSDVVTCSNKTITVTSQPATMTYRQDSNGLALATSRVVFYRTTDNGGTPPYYRLTVLDNDTATAATVSYSDTTSDATLSANAKLYEQPGVTGTALDRRCPPGLRHIVSYNGMLVGACGSNIWHSGQPVVGEQPWFNPVFQIPIEGEGDITGLWVMDGTLFVAKRRGIWSIAGDPPSDNGVSGGLGSPRRLSVDCGCIEQRSIVSTSMGVFFQSERGIELFSRAQTVEWIGESIQDEIASRPYVMAATLDPGEVLVYFELASGVTSGLVTGTGRTLVFDLSLRKWVSIDRRKDQAGTADKPAQSACMTYTGSAWRYTWMDAAGYVYQENQSSYLDPGSAWVTKLAESAWAKINVTPFKTPMVQGEQMLERVVLMGKYATDSNQAIALGYDYSTSYSTATTYTRAAIAAITTGTGGAGTLPNLHLQHNGHDDAGACMAVRAKVYDVTPTGGTVGTGQGSVWTSIAFQIKPTRDDGYLLPDGAA